MKKITLFLYCCLFSSMLFSATSRYRLILTDDPATTVMIGWEQASGTSATIHYGTTDFGTTWASYPNSKTVDRSVTYKGMNNTFAKLSGLTANTNYYFVIRDSEGVSQRFWFKTAPNTNDTMSFISGGDSRNNRTPRQNANRLVAKLKPTAVFFGGDMTNGGSNTEWQEWLDDWQLTTASDGRMFPIVPARGNHEGSNNVIYNLFNVPSTDVYYKITFGASLYTIYTLNSEITAGGSQYSWLQGQLTADNSVFKSAQYHKPMRPHVGSKSEGNNEYNNWAQLFYDEGVRLVYESDSHTVKTTWPVKPCTTGTFCEQGFERDDAAGTVYVGEGCWGAPLRTADDTKVWTRDSDSFNQFKWVCVSATQIDVKTIKVDNALSVGENANNAVCQLPTGIDVWNPGNGDVVTILSSDFEAPVVNITSHADGDYLTDGTNVTLSATATDSDGSVVSVDFQVNGVSVGTDTTAPYSVVHTFADGVYVIKVVATDDDGLTNLDVINIGVGTFTNQLDVAANEDVEQRVSDGNMYLYSSDLEFVYDPSVSGNQVIGIRFANVNIPKNAIINNAYVQFMADGDWDKTAEFLVYVEDDESPDSYSSSDNDVTVGRSYSASTYWSPAAWSDDDTGVAQRTPDLKNHIQNVVDKAGWSKGNPIAVKIEGTGVTLTDTSAKRKAESSEGNAAPVLHIEYSMSGVLNLSEQKHVAFNLYPNPVKDILYVDVPDTHEALTVEIFTISGTIIYKDKVRDYKVNVKHLRSGFYFINILDKQKEVVYTRKILKR